MTGEHRLWGSVVLVAAVVLGISGCASQDPTTPTASGSASPAPVTPTATAPDSSGSSAVTPTTTPPVLAGTSEASAAAALPTGAATGTIVITYSGLGQVDSPFGGTCSRSAGTTTVTGSAGSAQVDLVFDEAAVTLTVEDVGLGTSVALVGRADLAVDGGRLTLSAPLQQDGQPIGTTQVDVTCGA